MASPLTSLRNARPLLIAGFGGLLLLLAFAAVDAMQIVGQIQSRSQEIRGSFVARNRLLNQIRSQVYLAGTYTRDYLLEPDAANAGSHQASLARVHQDMDAALDRYAALLTAAESEPFARLREQLAAYWSVVDPMLGWNVEQRRRRGFDFMQREILPRRRSMLDLADHIALLNEQQLASSETQVTDLFAQFRRRLTATLLVTLALGALLTAISLFRILRLERESQLRFAEVVAARQELKDLSVKLVEAQETERRAISRELHDEVGQALSAVLVGLNNLEAAAAELKPQVDSLRGVAENSVRVVRNMALLLRPSMLDDLGLVAALQWQAREVSKQTGMLIEVAADTVSADLPDAYKTCLYRVVQEALHNCSRHASATSVRVEVMQEKSRLCLSVQDDGKGFPPATRGLGLVGMEERVTHLGGHFRIVSAPGQGTLIAVEIPLTA